MRPLLVDVTRLDQLAASIAALATRAEEPAAVVRASAAATPVAEPAAVGDAARRCAALVVRLRALAAVVLLVARRYTSVEQDLAAVFDRTAPLPAAPLAADAGASAGALDALLAQAGPDLLEGLLVAAPALAAAVVDAEAAGDLGPTGGDVAALPALVLASRRPGIGGRADWLAAQRRAHAAFVALGPRRLRLLALLQPSLVASAPSAPASVRWSANRVLVAADLDRLLRQQSAAPPGRAAAAVARQVAQRREWLDGAVTLRGPDGRERRQPHRLLRFDPRADGQVVEVLGDVDRADHLAVLVPGTGSDLQRYPGSLARASALAAADPTVAVVLWQGADFPDQPFDDGVLPLREHVVAAAYRDAADAAGPRLAADVEGLRVALPRAGSDLTVLGHSYGSAVVGSAQAHGMVADRVVNVAGAGTYAPVPYGTATDAGGPLSRHVTQQYSLTTFDDPVQLAQGYDAGDAAERWRAVAPGWADPAAPVVDRVVRVVAPDPGQVGLGPDPDRLPGVVRLDPGLHDDGRPVSGHSDMWTPGSTAWRNLLATTDGGVVSVLEAGRWSSHLQPARVHLGTGGARLELPRYVVDRSPWDDPGYRPPTAPTR